VAPAPAAWARAAGPLCLAALFSALTVWSWGKWTDVHIDFGGELYTAWRLAEGDVLHRDVATRHGPLSPGVNALLFRAFGVSLHTLVVANLFVLAAITALAWRLLARACDRIAATAACAFFLVVLGFSQYGPIANFNYATPYQHAQTHGLLLGLGLITALDAASRGRRGAATLAGACFGGLFLTKAELFAPAAATVGVAAVWCGAVGRRAALVRAALPFAAASILPALLCTVWLATAMPADAALRGVLGNWAHLGSVFGDPFYRSGVGLDRAGVHLWRMGIALLAVGAAVGVSAGVDRVHTPRGPVAAWLLGLAVAAAFVLMPLPAPGATARALPVATALLLVGGATLAVRHPDARERLFAPVLLATFALGLLAKLGLRPRFSHYGFALAAPATWLCVAAWVGGLPAALRARGRRDDLARATALAVCFAVAIGLWQQSDRRYARKIFPVGEGADRILAEPPETTQRPARLEALRVWLADRMAADETLLVLPEGVILNYWLRKKNPTPYQLFLPTEITSFGEATMLAALGAEPPHWVVLAHRESREFGVGAFGRDPRNGRALLAWVEAHYERVERFGSQPFGGGGFGAVVLRRRGSSGEQAP
jgi:hypothetical protein